MKRHPFTIRMSEELYQEFVKIAERSGLTMCATMVMALQSYIDTQKTLNTANNMQDFLDQIKALQGGVKCDK